MKTNAEDKDRNKKKEIGRDTERQRQGRYRIDKDRQSGKKLKYTDS
jgi:hypothetical protein